MAIDTTKPPSTQRHVFSKRKQLEKDLAHVTQEMYVRNLELAETNKALSLLRQIDSLVLSSQNSLEILCDQIVSAITSSTNYPFVGLMTLLPHKIGLQVVGLSVNSPSRVEINNILRKARFATKHPWLLSDEQTLALNFPEISTKNLAKFVQCTEEEAQSLRSSLPLQSVFLLKLTARQRLVGVLVVGTLHPVREVSKSERELLEQLGEAVGVALDNKLLFEENQRVVKQLQNTNEKLQALDEAKDEFISMASHQLRTPLTSVKGYISMVMEGDAGKITSAQRKLLNQSFISSQRMVFLIADLLNVSRLRTGKFILEPKPSNLADVVESETKQLVETAASRNLELTYSKPTSFPTLMLDETKIRQVIMNFIDNAIYYTPTGGHIAVNLVDKSESIELTVIDNGIGVPKHEQPHLFSKFYRAANAKKARPDGTGLGLFMAKKVIVAQGGSLIFKSEEGKGSTFGFSFAKSKLAVPTHLETSSKTD